MPQNRTNNPQSNDVGEALNLLSETLVEEEQRIRSEGSAAMNSGDYETATAVIEFAKKLLAFQGKVSGLSKEWDKLEKLRDAATPEVQKIVSKRFFGRRAKGDITTRDEYYRPVLQALVDLGGRAPIKKVINRVGEIMNPVLKPKDYEPHESNEKQIRWRNSAMWARNTMVNVDGRMKKGSPRGIWEISAKGRKWLEQQK